MNQVYYVGYDAVHPKDFLYNIPEGFHSYLLVLTTTPARFLVNGEALEYPAHTAILYPPRHAVWYGAANEIYGNHWLRFSSDESFVTNFPQMAVPFPISDPEYCHNLFQLLTWETIQLVHTTGNCQGAVHSTQNKNAKLEHLPENPGESELILSQLLRILFCKLHDELLHPCRAPHDFDLLRLRRKICAAPQLPWNITDMANQLHVSAGYLQLLYKQNFSVSCMEDVIQFRIFKARDLLAYTTQSITEIAAQCGYNNTEHFCRQFHKSTGISPGRYRKKISG